MLSHLELRHTVESAFLPTKCECEIAPDGTFSVKLINPDSGEVDLFVTGMAASELASSRSIANLVISLKEEASLIKQSGLQRRAGG